MRVLSLRFSRACRSYEDWAVPQRFTGEKLKSLEKVEGLVLDLGCGTGLVSEGLEKVVGLDIAYGMARAYREKFRRAVLGDAHSLPFKSKSFDFVLSNFALHWTQLDRSIPEALRVCRGLFLCAMPVEGSLPELGFPFPRVEKIGALLEKMAKLRAFFLEEVPIPFEGWDLLRFFHYTGTSYNPLLGDGIISRKRIENMIKRIDKPAFRVLFFSCEAKG
ncbi:MAG: methyltransferase domain-containing protein [Aquificaceae bacterium]|nr:methyltransferase domain-containing protein [Aquificaceae bacterium]MDW8097199.1 methyltransferase domain-containing protein [Aquificaceae bacterium]